VVTKVLIANRGEIALRIIRACRELGLHSVAVYSEADRTAPHVIASDEAYCIGPAPSRESYLQISRVIEAGKLSGASLVHPGYGFLSENAAFAQAVIDAGMSFVGPSPYSIDAMGSKALARQRVSKANVPCVPGYDGEDQSPEKLLAEGARVGFPILVKPANGGGGKGMKVVESLAELAEAIDSAKRQSLSSFGSDRLVLERYLRRPRHIEVQVFGDSQGNVVHLFERECSIQRRHQKIVEETPSIALNEDLRAKMCEAAINAAKSVQYQSAGTVEFLLDEDGSFYFLEMNTRLQVEHPVTEWLTGIDLVSLQLRLALGQPVVLSQEKIQRRGHAIEVRVYAEDASQGFLPSVGVIQHLVEPAGPGVRVDSGIRKNFEIPLEYDPMLSKVSCYGEDREQAIRRVVRALREYEILGVSTNIDYLCSILEHEAFARGDTTTRFLEEYIPNYQQTSASDEVFVAAAITAQTSPTKTETGQVRGGDPYSPWRARQ
jgi:acetyl-CoA carboxylase biotin carboxylase subunit